VRTAASAILSLFIASPVSSFYYNSVAPPTLLSSPYDKTGTILSASSLTICSIATVMSAGSLVVPRPSKALRRLSSQDATKMALDHRSPTVVVPPQHLMAPSNAHETAAAMELARHELEDYTWTTSSPGSPPETTTTDKYAFAFDIDGVLIRGGRPIPEAVEAMKVLNGQNPYGVKM